jgi:hypothetical protein
LESRKAEGDGGEVLTYNTLLTLFKLIRVLVSVLRRNPVDHNY